MQRQLKIQLAGAAVAIAAGVMLGGAIRPDLSGDNMRAPQMQMGTGAQRGGESNGDNTGFAQLASYHGALPDYVMGTDSTKPMGRQDAQAAPAAAVVSADDDSARDEPADAPAVVTRTSYEAPSADGAASDASATEADTGR